MGSPWGGDRGSGNKSGRKRGGQPGNVNRRASVFLPPAKDTEERRAFLDALTQSEAMSSGEQVRTLRNFVFARVMSGAELIGIQKILSALHIIDRNRWTELKVSRLGETAAREALKDQALGDIWKAVCECEQCNEGVDAVLRALELGLRQIGGVDGEQWLDRANEANAG